MKEENTCKQMERQMKRTYLLLYKERNYYFFIKLCYQEYSSILTRVRLMNPFFGGVVISVLNRLGSEDGEEYMKTVCKISQ